MKQFRFQKDIVILFEKANIDVIRVGLQTTEEICEPEKKVHQ